MTEQNKTQQIIDTYHQVRAQMYVKAPTSSSENSDIVAAILTAALWVDVEVGNIADVISQLPSKTG